jgi:predicted GNAT family acetyltransferase
MQVMTIKQTGEGKKGNFKAMDATVEAGRLVYSYAGQDKIIIEHTDVDPAFKGKSVGRQLVMAAVDYARLKNIKIMPLCPFANSVFEKTPEINDVLF